MNQKTDDSNDGSVPPGPELPAPQEPSVAEEPSARQARDAEADEPAAHVEDTRAVEPGRGRSMLSTAVAWVALLLALAAVGGVGYLAWIGRDSGAAAADNEASIAALSERLDAARASLQEIGDRLGDVAASGNELADDLANLGEQTGSLRRRVESIPARLSRLENSVASLRGISDGARDAWLLAEARYYMQIANASLQLAGDPERALLALRFADQRIRELADPALIEVRRALAEELRALEAMEKPDLEGMAMTLASLANSIESLSLKQDVTRRRNETEVAEAEGSGFDRALASIKNAFSGMVSVRRTDEPVTPLMSPEAEYFLRANLALKLQTARLALLRGEQAIFEQSLDDASDWLSEYYAAETQAVRSALQTMAELRDASFSVTLPDISESLRLLRQFEASRQADAPGADEPQSPAEEPDAPADESTQ